MVGNLVLPFCIIRYLPFVILIYTCHIANTGDIVSLQCSPKAAPLALKNPYGSEKFSEMGCWARPFFSGAKSSIYR